MPQKSSCPTLQNTNGGWYQRGRPFLMPRKLEISYLYLDLCYKKYPERPSQRDLATRARISTNYAHKEQDLVFKKNLSGLTPVNSMSIELCASQHEWKYPCIHGWWMIYGIQSGSDTYRGSSACINAAHNLERRSSVFYSTNTTRTTRKEKTEMKIIVSDFIALYLRSVASV